MLASQAKDGGSIPLTRSYCMLHSLRISANKIFAKFQILFPSWRYILLLFLVTRVLLTGIGRSSEILLEPFHGKENVWHYSTSKVLDIWGVWDTGWYLSIASHGYSAQVSERIETYGQANFAFFPLYPLVISFVAKGVGNYYLAGLFISNLSLLISLFIFYKLVRLDHEEKIALRAVKYLLLFPTAFILSGVFSEALYLLLVLLCFYFARLGKWNLVALVSFLTALARPPGVLIILPLLYEYGRRINFSFYKLHPRILLLLAPFLGLSVFIYFNFRLTNDPFAFIHIQNAWGRELVDPLNLLIKNFFSKDITIFFAVQFTLVVLGAVVLFIKKIRISYIIFALYSIFLPLSSGLISMPRQLVVIFPLAIICALATNKKNNDEIFTIAFCLLQGLLMVFWSNGFTILM